MGRESPGALGCVIGTIDLVRPLGLAGVRCAVVAPPLARVRYSRFVVQVIEWADPSRQPELLAERLMTFARRQAEKPVLYYEGDWDLLLVSRQRELLAQGFRFVVPDRDLVEQLVDKERFSRLAAEAGLAVPPSLRVAAGARTERIDLRFPLVVKPITRQAATWSEVGAGGKAIGVDDAASLRAVLDRLGESGADVLVQELIAGPETRIESHHAYVDATGAIAGEFTGRKVRTYPAAHGFSSALEITAAPDVAELGREVLARIGLRGVAKLDFKRDASGRLHLLEINPRFNLWHHLGAVAGVNIPALVYADAVGLPRPASGPIRAGVRWCHPVRDARARRAAGIGLGPWLRWLAACEAKSGLALDDPGPAVRGTAAKSAHAAARAVTSGAAKLKQTALPGER
jgi:predicted ATP-grasp superfamily ATP-dependent carboligase